MKAAKQSTAANSDSTDEIDRPTTKIDSKHNMGQEHAATNSKNSSSGMQTQHLAQLDSSSVTSSLRPNSSTISANIHTSPSKNVHHIPVHLTGEREIPTSRLDHPSGLSSASAPAIGTSFLANTPLTSFTAPSEQLGAAEPSRLTAAIWQAYQTTIARLEDASRQLQNVSLPPQRTVELLQLTEQAAKTMKALRELETSISN